MSLTDTVGVIETQSNPSVASADLHCSLTCSVVKIPGPSVCSKLVSISESLLFFRGDASSTAQAKLCLTPKVAWVRRISINVHFPCSGYSQGYDKSKIPALIPVGVICLLISIESPPYGSILRSHAGQGSLLVVWRSKWFKIAARRVSTGFSEIGRKERRQK